MVAAEVWEFFDIFFPSENADFIIDPKAFNTVFQFQQKKNPFLF